MSLRRATGYCIYLSFVASLAAAMGEKKMMREDSNTPSAFTKRKHSECKDMRKLSEKCIRGLIFTMSVVGSWFMVLDLPM